MRYPPSFTAEDEEFLKENACRFTAKELAAKLNLEEHVIYSLKKKHGLQFKVAKNYTDRDLSPNAGRVPRGLLPDPEPSRTFKRVKGEYSNKGGYADTLDKYAPE